MARRFFTPIDLTGTINESVAAPERSIKWSDGDGTLELGLKGNNVKLSVGQEEVALCYNGTGNTLYEGQVVYISGAQGQRPRVALASASSESSSSKTFGVVTENISAGQEGFVCTFGIVRGLNTSSFTEGSPLWLSTTPGALTQTMPQAPNHAVFVGYSIKSNANSGQIFVNIQNGYELQELHNVSINSLQDNDVLQYNASTQLWENSPLESVEAPDPIVPSGPAYPTTSLSNGELFYNTTNGRTAIYFDSAWREFAYVGDTAIFDNGNASTTLFTQTFDGGDALTTVFVGNYDGGNSI